MSNLYASGGARLSPPAAARLRHAAAQCRLPDHFHPEVPGPQTAQHHAYLCPRSRPDRGGRLLPGHEHRGKPAGYTGKRGRKCPTDQRRRAFLTFGPHRAAFGAKITFRTLL